jgi:hypothetical protein
MDIYHFRPENGEFIGQGLADPDPMNEGEFLYPAFCVTVEPPASQNGFARVWNGEDWTQVQDHRGEIWWTTNGEPVQIENLGNPSQDGYLEERPEQPSPPMAPLPKLIAVSLLQVVDDEVFTVGVSAGIAFAMRIDTGLIWVFFSEEMSDLNYSYSYTVTPSNGRATVTDRQLSYMEITVVDGSDQPVDPAEISIQIYRATL